MKKLLLAATLLASPAHADIVTCGMHDLHNQLLLWEFGQNTHNADGTLGTYVEERSANTRHAAVHNWAVGQRPIWIWRAGANGVLTSLQDRQNPTWTIQLGEVTGHRKGRIQVYATLYNNGVIKAMGECSGFEKGPTVDSVGDQGMQ
jgi:hypothetical protein